MFVLGLWGASALSSMPARGQTFSSTTTLVTIPVTVTDRANTRLVTGLGAADFRVLEEGVEQTVSVVTTERQPVSVCVVLDRSLSVQGTRQETSERLVDILLEQLPADDEVSLVTFGVAPTIELDWVRAGARKRVAWKQMPTGGGISAIADALTLAMRQLDRATKPRRVLLVLSDGRESGSIASVRKVATTRQQSETQLYAFGLGVIVPTYPANMQYLQKLVGDSGGYVHLVRSLEDAPVAVHDLLTELAGQYLLGYTPTRPFDGKYRRIVVEAKNRAFKVRHRGGYLALP